MKIEYTEIFLSHYDLQLIKTCIDLFYDYYWHLLLFSDINDKLCLVTMSPRDSFIQPFIILPVQMCVGPPHKITG